MSNIDYSVLPVDLREGMRRYVEEGIPTGGFLRAVLENDLFKAVKRADVANRRILDRIVLILRDLPIECWGNEYRVDAWIENHRIRRERAAGVRP